LRYSACLAGQRILHLLERFEGISGSRSPRRRRERA